MGIEYVNRRGERYYLLQGETKTGKPKYYASRKPKGTVLKEMPEGFEFRENPERGLVSIRKKRSTSILEFERAELESLTRTLAGIKHFVVDIQDDSLVIYTPGEDPTAIVTSLSSHFEMFGSQKASTEEWFGTHATYLAMLRFTLTNENKRLFTADRWCFLGSIDTWFPLAGPKPLRAHAQRYLPHLNKESFFEMM